ncbi:hypothetical protein, partial [Thiolapillus sp.]|uniref:hypothetical protein n=1 Tax=Thiolapillus sp. TaxID=2017437 RepID=UPI003AF97197
MNGVPDGWYFLVTDVTIMPNTDSETGEYTFNFHHIGGCNTGVDGGGGSIERILLKVVPNSQT